MLKKKKKQQNPTVHCLPFALVFCNRVLFALAAEMLKASILVSSPNACASLLPFLRILSNFTSLFLNYLKQFQKVQGINN